MSVNIAIYLNESTQSYTLTALSVKTGDTRKNSRYKVWLQVKILSSNNCRLLPEGDDPADTQIFPKLGSQI